MSSAKHISDLRVLQRTKQLNSLKQVILLDQSFKLNHFVSVSSYYEIYMRIFRNNLWNQPNQKINSFTILQSGYVNHVYLATRFFFSYAKVWKKS